MKILMLAVCLSGCASISYDRINADGSKVHAYGISLFNDGAFSGLKYQGDGKGAMAFGVDTANGAVSPELGQLVSKIVEGAVKGATK